MTEEERDQYRSTTAILALVAGVLFSGMSATLYFQTKQGFAGIDAHFDRIDTWFDSRFGQVDSRFSQMENRFDARFDKMDTRLDTITFELGEIRQDIGRIDGRLNVLEEIRAGVQDLRADKAKDAEPVQSQAPLAPDA